MQFHQKYQNRYRNEKKLQSKILKSAKREKIATIKCQKDNAKKAKIKKKTIMIDLLKHY